MIRARILAVAVLACVGLGACYPRNATRIQGIHDDQFSTSVEIDGADIWSNPLGGPTRNWYLVSLVDKKTHAVFHSLSYSIVHAPPMYYYDSAADDTAKSLPTKGDHERSCVSTDCREYEGATVMLDGATLATRMTTGYKIKVMSRNGLDDILEITPVMIQLQFQAVNQVLASLGAPPVVAVAPQPGAAGGPMLGVHVMVVRTSHPAVAREPGLQGLEVLAIDPGSPAARGGIVVGDVIVDYDGKPVTNEAELRAAIAAGGGGRVIPVELLHLTQPGHFVAQVPM